MKKQKNTFTSIILALSCFAFLPQMQALSPPPDGCYPNFTTAEGCNALQSLTTGAANTGLGWYALFGTSTGNFNTGVGAGALVTQQRQIPIRQWAPQPFCSTPRAQGTAPLEQPPWSITTTVPIIRLWARSR